MKVQLLDDFVVYGLFSWFQPFPAGEFEALKTLAGEVLAHSGARWHRKHTTFRPDSRVHTCPTRNVALISRELRRLYGERPLCRPPRALELATVLLLLCAAACKGHDFDNKWRVLKCRVMVFSSGSPF